MNSITVAKFKFNGNIIVLGGYTDKSSGKYLVAGIYL